MTYDTTGLIEINMKRANNTAWRGKYYVHPRNEMMCVAKTCSSCKEVLPSKQFGYSSNKKFNLYSTCIQCSRKENSRRGTTTINDGTRTVYAKSNRDKKIKNKMRTHSNMLADQRRIRPSGAKTCYDCRKSLPLREYHKCTGSTDGLQTRCKSCETVRGASRYTKDFLEYWASIGVPLKCYLCGGPYEQIEHLIPRSLGGDPGPQNTRPSCYDCNRGTEVGKWDTPLEMYIFTVNHPDKSRAQILYDIVSKGSWPFANTSPEEFLQLCDKYSG